MRLFKDNTKNVADDFLKNLESSICLASKPSKLVKSTFYKPSSLNCLRMMYYYRTQKTIDEVVRPASSIGILHSGEDRHIRIQRAISNMQESGFDCEWVDVEQYIKDNKLTYLQVVSKKEFETTVHNTDLDLLFLCDGIVKINGSYYLVEIKTESASSFYSRVAVAEEHKHQAACYSISFNINKVIFIYENRDLCLKKAFLFEVPVGLKNEVVGMIERCNEYVAKKELPNKLECKSCTYCDYRKKCKNNEV